MSAVVFPVDPAHADQIGDLKAQAAQISQKLVQDQLEIDAYQQQYSAASERVADDTRVIAELGQQISRDQKQINTDMHAVRALAIRTYMSADSQLSSTAEALFAVDPVTAQVAIEYSSLATGNIQSDLDSLHGAQQTSYADQAALRQQQRQDQQSQAQQAAALQAANSTKSQLQSLQSQVTGQLAAAISAQAAAQAAKAAAAVAAAQRAAAAKGPTSTGSTSSTQATQGSSLPDPALNPFLQCVVQAESGGNYQAVSPDGTYMGAFQFTQATWDLAAQAAGLPYLVGVPPNLATKAEQDTVAVALYSLDGQQPWLGDRCS